MEIIIRKFELGKEEDYKLKYSYLEGQSRQEGKPSFFISANDKKRDFEIEFLAENIKELDNFILDIQNFRKELE